MKKIKVKPGREGLIVRDPISLKQLKVEGEEKPLNAYWSRRLRCGDCVEAGGLPPPAEHPIEARMADEDFAPPAEPKKKSSRKADTKKGDDK